MRKLHVAAYRLAEKLKNRVVGQDHLADALQQAVVEYVRSFGTRSKDPVARHLMGLTGIGKSEILNALCDELEALGVTILRFDVQRWASPMADPRNDLVNAFRRIQGPTLVLFDELDKIPELVRKGGHLEEVSNAFTGVMNEILTDGAVATGWGQPVPVHDVLFLSSMNLSSEEFEEFSAEVLGASKTFYEYDAHDFAEFHRWVQRDARIASSKLLSRLFRQNTVGRIASNALIARPPGPGDYLGIIEKKLQRAIAEGTTGPNAARRLSVSYTPRFLQFLAKNAVYEPSGSRDTVFKVRTLADQLLDFGMRSLPPSGDAKTLCQPRALFFDATAGGANVRLAVTPFRYAQGRENVALPTFQVPVAYDRALRIFREPESLAQEAPEVELGTAPAFRLTKKQILASRFGERKNRIAGFPAYVGERLFGQERTAAYIENRLNAFFSRKRVSKHTDYMVLAGITGQGKSELVHAVAEYTGLPRARVNLQAFTGTETETVDRFLDELNRRVSEAQRQSEERGLGGRYILEIEEMDKAFEVNPQTRAIVDRPVMNVIKDLLNDRILKRNVQSGFSTYAMELDFAKAFVFVTMNFAIDPFGFSADPRVTTVEDVVHALEEFSRTPADQKRVLEMLFHQETVSRIFDRLVIVPAANRKTYERILAKNVEVATADRLLDPKTRRNDAVLDVETSAAYRAYLFQEGVIPAFGPRYTVGAVQRLVERDLDDAIRAIPRSGPLAATPLRLRLDYDAGKMRVLVKATPIVEGQKPKAIVVVDKPVALRFPDLRMDGPLPEFRVHIAAHEYGHGYTAVRFGLRVESLTVVALQRGIEGQVKTTADSEAAETAKTGIARLYTLLGGRAMERFLLSTTPTAPTSVETMSTGSRGDLRMVTRALWDFLYEYGFDLESGPIDRWGVDASGPYAKFDDLPDATIRALQAVLRDMEDFVVRDFEKAHPKDWHADRIYTLAQQGYMSEQEFYDLLGYAYPGKNTLRVGEVSPIQALFGDRVEGPSESIAAARAFRQGETATTAAENLEAATKFFYASLRKHLPVVGGCPGAVAQAATER